LYEFNATADELGLDRLGYYNYCFYAFNGTVLYRRPIGYDEYFDFELVNTPPELYPVENLFEPKIGFPNTEFIFRVNYTDIDNDTPEYVKLVFDPPGPTYHPYPVDMYKEDPNDTNYVDGVIYRCEISNLVPGTYYYHFKVKENEIIYEFYNDTDKSFVGSMILILIEEVSSIMSFTTLIIGVIPVLIFTIGLIAATGKYQVELTAIGLAWGLILTGIIIANVLTELFSTPDSLKHKITYLWFRECDTATLLVSLILSYIIIGLLTLFAILGKGEWKLGVIIGAIITMIPFILGIISFISGIPIDYMNKLIIDIITGLGFWAPFSVVISGIEYGLVKYVRIYGDILCRAVRIIIIIIIKIKYYYLEINKLNKI